MVTSAIRAILLNPRYTGRQVWNKQRTDEVLIDVEDVALGHQNRHRWNDPSQWVWSTKIAHTPLISTELYERAQQAVRVRGTNGETGRAPRRSTHPSLFRGLLRCGLCGRRMEGSVNHGRRYYRCAATRDFVRQHKISHPPVLYLREDAIAMAVDQFLHEELGHRRLATTLRRLTAAQHRATPPAEDDDEQAELRRTVADCDAKITRYRAALDAGGDPALIAGWIKETSTIKAATQARISIQPVKPQRMTEDQIAAIVEGLGGLLALLHDADPRDRAEIYARVGLQMTYRPGSEMVLAQIVSTTIDRVGNVCPRGGLEHTYVAPVLQTRGHARDAMRLWVSSSSRPVVCC